MPPTSPKESLRIAQLATQVLDDLQAEDPLVLDVRGLSSVTDYYLLVSGNSTPHLNALAEELDNALRKQSIKPWRKSGTADSGWVVLDYVDIVVHVMTRDAREYYSLEELWKDAKRLDWPLPEPKG